MIYHWYVFLLLVVAYLTGNIPGYSSNVEFAGTTKKEYRWLPILVLIIPLILLAGNRGHMNGFGDSTAYINGYLNSTKNYSSIPSVLMSETKDKGFLVLTYVLRNIFGENYALYLTTIAAVSIVLISIIYKKYSISFFLSVFLFIASGDYIQWGYNGIRQFLAAAIVFCGISLFLNKKYISFGIIVLLASTIHLSALVVLPIIIIIQGKAWNKRTLLFLVVVILVIFFIDQFSNFFTNLMESTQYKKEVSQFEASKGTNVLRVLVYTIPAIISLIFVQKIRELDNPIINLCVGMSIATSGFYIVSAFTSGLFLGRLTIYFSLFNYILLPWELEYLINSRYKRILKIVTIVLYLVFYYYQVQVTWNL